MLIFIQLTDLFSCYVSVFLTHDVSCRSYFYSRIISVPVEKFVLRFSFVRKLAEMFLVGLILPSVHFKWA